MTALGLEIYRDLFARQIAEDSSVYIENGSRSHAKIVISELVKSAQAQGEILIQCSHFSSDVYDNEVVSFLNAAVSRGCTVRIAIRGTHDENSLVSELRSDIQVEDKNYLPVDFCVVDGRRFRLELDAEKREATACANDPELGAQLVARFASSGV